MPLKTGTKLNIIFSSERWVMKEASQWFISDEESGYISKEGKKALEQRKVTKAHLLPHFCASFWVRQSGRHTHILNRFLVLKKLIVQWESYEWTVWMQSTVQSVLGVAQTSACPREAGVQGRGRCVTAECEWFVSETLEGIDGKIIMVIGTIYLVRWQTLG